MAISTILVVGVLAFGPGHPLGDMPAYLDAMGSAAQLENAEAQVAEVLNRHVLSFQGAKRLAKASGGAGAPQVTQIRIAGDRASAVVSTSDRTEFVQLVRSNHKWLVVPPERERPEY